MTSHYKRFIKNLKDDYDMDLDALKSWRYGGGNSKSHLNYFKLLFKDDLPAWTSRCVCGKEIVENCYIYKETEDEIQFLILGNECIKKFLPEDKIGRRCEICNAKHRRRKSNKCKDCQVGFCVDCDCEIDDCYTRCRKCYFK